MNSADLCSRAGITYRQLDHWARKGYLGHEAAEHTGTGYGRDWTHHHLGLVQRMALAVHAGLTPQAAADIAHGHEKTVTDGRLVLTIDFKEAS